MITQKEAGKIPYVVCDLETSINNRGDEAVGNFQASPFAPKNSIVAAGWKTSEWKCPICIHKLSSSNIDNLMLWRESFHTKKILVGHNIKFDMHYLARYSEEWRDWFKHNRVWDTMLAEYILEGQLNKYPSLNHCAAKYGGTLKDEKIAQYWEEGVSTEDIPKDELVDYLRSDVTNTEIVFLSQLELAKDLGMLPLIFSQMEGLMATFEMEHNGMYFDTTAAYREMAGLELVRDFQAHTITNRMTRLGIPNPNPSSNQQISCVLFGGEIESDVRVPMLDDDGSPVLYKSGINKGNPRFKREKTVVKIEGLLPRAKDPELLNKDGKTYKVNDEVLKNILENVITSYPNGKLVMLRSFIEAVLKFREVNKDISTYFQRSLDLVWDTGLIHPTINHCATGTGRLSQTNPNMQNYTGGDSE